MSFGYAPGGANLRWVPLVLGLIAAGFFIVQGCQEGPFGRKQLVGLTPQEESRLGAQAFQQVLREESDKVLPQSAPVVQIVQKVGERLAKASQKKEVLDQLKLKPREFQWEFRVIETNQVNAFCLPGGKVVVYTGILPVCRDENGLATVMGHEIGHALARHGAERVGRQRLEQIGQLAVAGSLGDLPPEKRAAIMVALGAATQYGVQLPFDRQQESEADHIGLLLMAAAGYDPAEAVPFWERMAKVGGRRPPEFMSTHPGPENRAAALRGWLKEAEPLYEHSNQQRGTRPLPWPPSR